MDRVTLFMDGQELLVPKGQKLLWAALDAGIDIPHLCARRDRDLPFGGCRLCFVEVQGRPNPVTSCTVDAVDGMTVTTRSARVDRLVASAFEMLMSHHHLECRRCPANHHCELQRIARLRRLKLKPLRVPKLLRQPSVDESHPLLRLDRSKCVLCGQCVWVCEAHGSKVLDFSRRGLATELATFGDLPLGQTACDGCLACAEACPTGALWVHAESSLQR